MINLERPLDLEDPEADAYLEGIQGNIIKGHGRDFTRHILLKMTGDPQAVRRWIVDFAEEQVTSARTARRQTLAWRAQQGPGEPFAMFLLSPHGYRHLGFPDAQPPIPGGAFTQPVHREYFFRGMKKQLQLADLQPPGRTYRDPPSTEWEQPYQQDIHAMVLLADDDPERLERSVSEIVRSIPGILEDLTIERGRAIKQRFPNPPDTEQEPVVKVIEHFGFQDGISQPQMIKQELDKEVRERGSTYWNPVAPLALALVQEPGPAGGYGSFMVFRKLEQNVKAFWDTIGRLSEQTDILSEDAAAMAVGRYRDGTPRVPTSTIDPKTDPNDFHYGLDPRGGACPFHAHIRKTNPRGDVPCVIGAPASFERARRIVRRGITYGERPDLLEGSTLEQPSEGVGLLFMCFQSNLDQFVIQQEGSDDNDFVRGDTGVDAVIGQNPTPDKQTWPSTAVDPDDPDKFKFTMANLVRMRGGEYFFAPSTTFLKGLAQG